MKMTVRLSVLLSCLLFCLTAQAAPTLIFSGNTLIGADGVLVGATLYNVRFVDGTCAAVFGACDAAHFAFTDEEDAEEAADALMALVLIDQGIHPLNSQPNLTYGCPGNLGSTKCDIWTPYEVGSGFIPGSNDPVPFIEFINFRNSANPILDKSYYGEERLDHVDLSIGDHEVWAVWTPTSPNAIPITVQTNPSGLQINVDGVVLTAPQTFSWISGTAHTIATASPQGSKALVNWSDAGAISHAVSPTAATTYTATFTTTAPGIAPDLTISKSHVGNFTQGQLGVTYSIVASNVGTASTSGTVTVSNSVSSGLIATSISGAGWNCVQPAGPCNRNDALGAGLSYPAITLIVDIAGGAPSATNSATVSGGGETNFANDTANDPTTIDLPAPVQLVFNSDNILIGANRVLVGTRFYDVKFVDGTCAIAYGACDEAHFAPFANTDDAVSASEALAVLVLLDQGSHPLNSQPSLTWGCPGNLGSTVCDIWTASEIVAGTVPEFANPVPFVEFGNYRNAVNPLQDLVSYQPYPVHLSNVSYGDHENWAVWNLSTAGNPVPGPIAKSSPANASTAQPRVPTLIWGAGGDATSYEFCVDATNNNACDTGWNTTEGTSGVVAGLNPSTTYYWQVRGRNSAGTAEADSGVWSSFTTAFSRPLNVAAASNGATASASSTFNPGYAPGAAINGDRRGIPFGSGGVWIDGTPATFPDWLQVDFAGPQTIDEVDLFSVQDDYAHPIEPVKGLTFTQYGVDLFEVQYWNGSAWVNVPGGTIIGNDQVWRQVAFPALTTSRIRILVSGGIKYFSRIAEVEVYSDSFRTGNFPGALVKSSPANSSASQPLILTLAWPPSSGATSYEYCLDTINNSSCDTSWISTPFTSAVVAGLNASSTYYWQVRALNAIGTTESNNGAWWSFTTSIGSHVNVAAAANGATAIASSYYNPGYPAIAAINGDRKGVSLGNGGSWTDQTELAFPDWLQVDFAGPQPIHEVDIFSVQDNFASPAEPVLGMPFTQYGITNFQVQYWNGSSWLIVPGGNITGNNQVWRQIVFAPITTSSIRIYVTGALSSYSRISEVEAYSDIGGGTTPPSPFVKSSPANAAAGQSLSPTLSWAAANGGISYEYCIDTINNNSCDTNWITTTNTSVVVNGLNTGVTYFWQVRARNSLGTTDADIGAWWSFTNLFGNHVNVAASANGATASASSFYNADHPPSAAINGDRKGLGWGHGGGWNDATDSTFPDTLQVDFASPQAIYEVDVFTLQDAYANPAEPVLGMPFSLYGVTAFQVQYWDGSSWLVVPGGTISGNNQVWRQIVFAPVTTQRIRVVVSGALAAFSRIIELEAYSNIGSGGTTPGPLVKSSPANTATAQPLSMTLAWGVSSGASSYEYCIDTINNNSCDTSWISTTNTSVVAGGLSGSTTYFWQVRARNSAGTTDADIGAWWSFTTLLGNHVNVASTVNGGTASASSFYNAGFAPAGAINGDRKGLGWGNGGGWNDGTPDSYPDWLQVDFAGPQTIDEVDVFSVQDAYANPVEPFLGQQFSLHGVTAFQVQYWNGSTWVVAPGGDISGNNQVWRQIVFSAVTTSKIRIQVTSSLASWSRIVEVEAYADIHAVPGVFAKSAPANNATGLAPIPTLSWSPSLSAASYEYCVDTINNNSCDTAWVSTPFTSVALNGLNAGATYFWQVRARNSNGTADSDTGAWWNFTIPLASLHVNVAAASNGGTASASSFYSGAYASSGAIDGNRKGQFWGNGGGWNDGTPDSYPDWLQVDFAGAQSIDEIDVFSVQDAYANPAEPFLGQAFSLHGVTAFQAQYWNGSAWVTVPNGSITGNNQVWRQILFSAITTSKIRINVTAALATWSRIVEVEAYSNIQVSGQLPGPPAKSAPANGSTGQGLGVALSWGAGSDAVSYEVCVDAINNNSCDTVWTSTPSASGIAGGLNQNTTYFWQVRARNGTGVTEANGGAWWSFTTGSFVNVAAAANGATASASSFYNAQYAPSGAIDGERKGQFWGNGGGWNDGTPDGYPDWLQVDFAAAKAISEVDVFTVQDAYANPSEPTPGLQFTLHGLTDFQVQYWNGSSWVDVPNGHITGNTLVWGKINFPSLTTTGIRILVNASLASWSRITEVEAY